jgi:hypothetical protein
MAEFLKEINLRLEQLRKDKAFETKKKNLLREFKSKTRLLDENGEEIIEITEFQIAFLSLLKERSNFLFEDFKGALQAELTRIYEESEEPDLQNLRVETSLGLYNILMPSETDASEEWQLQYNMSEDFTIFHVYFLGWKFDFIGITF